MQVVILAAGVGSRLERLTGGRPKCLTEIGGRPLILHQLAALADHGVGPVLIVLGHEQQSIRDVVGDRAEYLINERFRETNSLHSLWLARTWVTGPFVLINGDLLFDPDILSRLLDERDSALAYDSTSSRGREQTKVAVARGAVVDLGKDLPPASARGESLGLLKFEADGARAMLEVADELMRAGHEQAWVIEATRAVCRMVPIRGVNVAGLPWTEIDFPNDVEEARTRVWPAIRGGRWRRAVFWRRTRWLAAGIGALAIAVAGWMASARVGPASVDWENVVPEDAPAVALRAPNGSQRWWSLAPGDSLTASIDAAAETALRLEFRLLLAPDRPAGSRYVVAVTVAGVSEDWEAFTATPDSTVSVGPAGAPVGDRDRLELVLPAGHHVLRIALLAGHGSGLLVRVRRPG